MNLSYNEFEILQLLVRSNGVHQQRLSARAALAGENSAKSVIRRLLELGLVRDTGTCITPTATAATALAPYRVKRGIILAAGKGERMRPATNTVPKPMVWVQQRRLIQTQLDALRAAGINEITVVRGYLGEAFDVLLEDYPDIKFIDNPLYSSTGAIVSAALAIDLLANAYLIEGDLHISNPTIIRPYEYRSSYCGIAGEVIDDWHFYVDNAHKLLDLAYGTSGRSNGKAYRFIGIMHWTSESARQLAQDIGNLMSDPRHHQRFIESVPFDTQTGHYDIFVRPVEEDDVVEVDTHDELLRLRRRQSEQQFRGGKKGT